MYHVLHQHKMPRHPPYALSSFIENLSSLAYTTAMQRSQHLTFLFCRGLSPIQWGELQTTRPTVDVTLHFRVYLVTMSFFIIWSMIGYSTVKVREGGAKKMTRQLSFRVTRSTWFARQCNVGRTGNLSRYSPCVSL